jgi:hypothetical protein
MPLFATALASVTVTVSELVMAVVTVQYRTPRLAMSGSLPPGDEIFPIDDHVLPLGSVMAEMELPLPGKKTKATSVSPTATESPTAQAAHVADVLLPSVAADA